MIELYIAGGLVVFIGALIAGIFFLRSKAKAAKARADVLQDRAEASEAVTKKVWVNATNMDKLVSQQTEAAKEFTAKQASKDFLADDL